MTGDKSRLAAAGLRISVLGLVILALGILAHRFGVADFRLALLGLAGGAGIGLLGALVSAIALVIGIVSSRRGVRTAIAGLVIGLLVAAPVGQTMIAGSKVPGIHDVTTDLGNPPAFDAVVAERGDTSNPLDRAQPADLAELQAQAYPDLTTLESDMQPGKVYEATLETAREMGWEIVASNPEAGMIEATATTRVMNFKDDVAIRVTERGEGAAVDMRSVSRVGISDMGANANRIRTYLHALKVKLDAAE
jgi:uncharacterized protein (DUF1499 family)